MSCFPRADIDNKGSTRGPVLCYPGSSFTVIPVCVQVKQASFSYLKLKRLAENRPTCFKAPNIALYINIIPADGAMVLLSPKDTDPHAGHVSLTGNTASSAPRDRAPVPKLAAEVVKERMELQKQIKGRNNTLVL